MKLHKKQALLLVLFLMPLHGLQTSVQAQSAPSTQLAPTATSTLWGASAKTYAGDLPVHVDSGRVYMEIPTAYIGREMLISAQVNCGFDFNAHPIKSLGVVQIVAPNTETILLKPLKNVAEGEMIVVKNEADRGIVYPVLERTKTGAAIIDITNELLTGKQWFSYQELYTIREMVPDLSSLLDVKANNSITQFRIRRYHGQQAEEGNFSSSMIVLPEGSVPLELSCRVQLLPQTYAPIRLATKGVKNLTVPTESTSPTAENNMPIQRWALNRPLTFYIDSLFPPQYIGAVKAGVAAWNQALADAGIPNALQVEQVTPQTDVTQPRMYVSFELGRQETTSEMLCHPLSGELLRGWINVGKAVLEGRKLDYFLYLPHFDMRFWDENSTDAIVQETIQGRVMAQVAQVLGIFTETDYGPSALQLTDADRRAVAYAYAAAQGNTPYEQHSDLQKRLSIMPQAAANNAERFDERVQVMDNVLQLVPSIDQKANMAEYKDEQGFALWHLYRDAVGTYGNQLVALSETFDRVKQTPLQRTAMRLLSKYLMLADSGLVSKRITENQLTSKGEELSMSLDGVFSNLFSTDTFTMLLKQGTKRGGYGINEHLGIFCNALFNSIETTHMPSNYLANLQLRYITALNKAAKNAHKGSKLQLWLQRKIATTRTMLATIAQKCTSNEGKAWYKLLQNRR